MTNFIQFAIFGLGAGAVYALLAQGVIAVFRGSGVLNFAHGAFAMVGAYTCCGLTLSLTAPAVSIALWAGFRFTTVGLATAASAENRRAAAALGWSEDRLAMVNWGVGAAIAAAAGILVAPITGLDIYQ